MRKSLLNAVGWLLPLLVALLATPLLIGTLGAARYGVWALCLVLVTLVPTLDFGFCIAAVREVAAARSDDRLQARVLAELATITLGLAALAWLVIAAAAQVLAGWLNFDHAMPAAESASLVRLLAAWAALAVVNNALTVLPRGRESFGTLAVVAAGSSLGLWVGATALALMGYGLGVLVAYAIVLNTLLALALLALHRRTLGSWPRTALKVSILPARAHFAGASFIGSLASAATYHADKILVATILGPAPAGLYTAASNVASKLLGLVAALGAVLFPRVSTIAIASSAASIAHLYGLYFRAVMTVCLVLAVTGIVLADRFLTLWLGSNATPDLVLAFRMLIVAYVAASTSVVASNVLSGRGNAHRGALFALLGGVLTVGAGLLLIPHLGLEGAGLAAIIGMSQALAFDLWMRRELAEEAGMPAQRAIPWLGWTSVCIAAAGAAALGSLAPGWPGLLLGGASGVVVATGLWFAAGFASEHERHLAHRIVKVLTGSANG